MKKKLEILIILDSLNYKKKEHTLKEDLTNVCEPAFYYTYYENSIVNFFQKMPILGNLLSHISYWSISLYEAIKIFFFKKKFFYKIFINPIVAIFYCFFIKVFKRKEHIVIAGFLFEHKKNRLYLKIRKWFVNFCYKDIALIVVYSKYEVQFYSALFPSLAAKFIFIKYGRDYDFFKINNSANHGQYIASGGVSNRDFDTLLAAFKVLKNDLPEAKCKIATKPKGLLLQTDITNIEVVYDIMLKDFGNFLDNSLFVIIPLANTPLSAGHMVLLEAMYYGKIILITDISSIRDYVDQEAVYFYKAEDPQDLAVQIKYLYLNKNSSEVVRKTKNAKDSYLANYTFSNLLIRIVKAVL